MTEGSVLAYIDLLLALINHPKSHKKLTLNLTVTSGDDNGRRT